MVTRRCRGTTYGSRPPPPTSIIDRDTRVDTSALDAPDASSAGIALWGVARAIGLIRGAGLTLGGHHVSLACAGD